MNTRANTTKAKSTSSLSAPETSTGAAEGGAAGAEAADARPAAAALADSLTSSDDGDAAALEKWMDSLSEENLTLAKFITKIISVKFDSKFAEMKKDLEARNNTIQEMSTVIDKLKERVGDLESNLEELQQYSTRECMVFNGPSLPAEEENEDTTKVII